MYQEYSIYYSPQNWNLKLCL